MWIILDNSWKDFYSILILNTVHKMQSILGNSNKDDFGEISIINSKKLGSFLEWITKRIFQSIGCYASNTITINGNQIDVFVNIGDIKIICECKQYEKNSKPIKSLIYEWSAKRDEMKCNKAILILWGYPKIEEKDMELSNKLNVGIWNDTKIEIFFNMLLEDTGQTRKSILLDLNLNAPEVEKIKNEILRDIENNFSGEVKSIWKDEILSCFYDGVLVNVFKFSSIIKFLKKRLVYIRAMCWGESGGRGFNYFLEKNKQDIRFESIVDTIKTDRENYSISSNIHNAAIGEIFGKHTGAIDEFNKVVHITHFFEKELKELEGEFNLSKKNAN